MANISSGAQVHEHPLKGMMSIDDFRCTLDDWGRNQVPFFFMVDFEMEKPVAMKLADVDANRIRFDIRGMRNVPEAAQGPPYLTRFEKYPISWDEYKIKFDQVFYNLSYGNSFLTNLTVKTRIALDASLEELFDQCEAKYKLMVKDRFIVFSPEPFIRIEEGIIRAFPMKGTIDASLPNAEQVLLEDVKELAEHTTIVDLLRNDLSHVAQNVEVPRFRYLEKLYTSHKTLLQASSEIKGTLLDEYSHAPGSVLVSLLPAGSVSGAPKHKTCSIIRDAEGEPRGYYTGVFGCFDGNNLDSGVMIRYIEKDNQQLFYRSGGGITTQSSIQNEYDEVIDKVYVPFD